jgi:hypothetical protein
MRWPSDSTYGKRAAVGCAASATSRRFFHEIQALGVRSMGAVLDMGGM